MFAFLLYEIDVRRVVEGIDTEAFLGLRGNQGSVLGSFHSVFDLCLGHSDLLFSCESADSAREGEPSLSGYDLGDKIKGGEI
jgi:hypothetical protein